MQISYENTCVGLVTLLKGDSNTVVSLWKLLNFSEHLFCLTPPVAVSRWRAQLFWYSKKGLWNCNSWNNMKFILFIIKGTLTQIWKFLCFFCVHIIIIPWKFSILNPKNPKLFSCKVCKMFVYKPTEIIEYAKKQSTF